MSKYRLTKLGFVCAALIVFLSSMTAIGIVWLFVGAKWAYWCALMLVIVTLTAVWTELDRQKARAEFWKQQVTKWVEYYIGLKYNIETKHQIPRRIDLEIQKIGLQLKKEDFIKEIEKTKDNLNAKKELNGVK